MKKILLCLGLVLLCAPCFARENIKEVFKNNSAIIYTVNIRNFNAQDKDLDGLIDPKKGDVKGTFLNALEKLPDLKKEGINTIYLLPITPVGKLKALGTKGSLYSLDSFENINPELDDTEDKRTVIEEAKAFVKKAHELDLNVIVDLPGCASYDLSLRKPDWFEMSENNESQIVADWTDVRQLKIDENLIKNTKKFVDLMIEIDFDGIRADVAGIKTPEFWSEIINYAYSKKADFLFLAEASPDWSNPSPSSIQHYSTIEELLESGFDSYYGSWSDFKNLKTKQEFDLKLEKNLKIIKKYKNSSMISALATHDQQAPVLRGKNYWNMVLWLCVTLPQNTYFLDGFSVGDDFIYPYENKKAQKSDTDDEEYFVHNGQFDIFNATAPVRKKHPKYKQSYLKAINFKKKYQELISKGDFRLLKTNNDKVFGFAINDENKELIVIGSLDEKENQKTQIKPLYSKPEYLLTQFSGKTHPKTDKEILEADLEPLELQVYLINKVNLITPQE
ncbi:MAG: hypothetical protein IJ877_03070 [Candidatus Gastranaerophilales bacterium]|nr:hypothetical protein [Candidatus Gastranaerophilales bacterium]